MEVLSKLFFTWEIVKIEISFQLKAFELHDLSKYPLQLHVGPYDPFKYKPKSIPKRGKMCTNP